MKILVSILQPMTLCILFLIFSNSCKNEGRVDKNAFNSSISLRERGIKQIPDSLFQYLDLKILDLAMNEIRVIPSGISQLENLEVLTIAYGRLDSVNCGIASLQKLKELNLLDNELKYIPDCICQLKSLEFLNLSANPIEKLPECLKEMTWLKTLGIGNYGETPVIPMNQIDELKIKLPNCDIRY